MTEQTHVPGKPMYSVGDRVSFEFKFRDGNIETFDGIIEIVDRFGAWEIENPREPSYDILIEDWKGSGTQMFVKHIRESEITKKTLNYFFQNPLTIKGFCVILLSEMKK